jgi:hypothetical protein
VKSTSLWLPILAALISVGAGAYLLTEHAEASDSIFNPFLHGIGAYFIARGLYMGWAAARTADQLNASQRDAKCPFCFEDIHAGAFVCPHCQRDLVPAGHGPRPG